MANFNPQPKKSSKQGGECELFQKIWNKRSHYCQVCFVGLGDIPRAIFFSHILSKGAYPNYRLNEENIWLCCDDCHRQWEVGNKFTPKFKKKLELKNKLKQEYYNK